MNTVRVRLRKPRRVHQFLCGDLDIHRNEPCLVQTERGMEWGVCVLPPEPIPRDMEKRFKDRVVRKATMEDERTHSWLIQEEKRAFDVGQKRMMKRDLAMKLVDCEYTFDKKKIIFYFTADDRVDFRELVRDLAHELRSRIELRHIQVRDEARMVGGIGSCGRELCCSTWLGDFKPISMRMAKRQNLSLNPSKISGQCGRLLCCLAYENDQYEAVKRQAKRKREDLPAPPPTATAKAKAALENRPKSSDWEQTEAPTSPSILDEFKDTSPQPRREESRPVEQDRGGSGAKRKRPRRRRGKGGPNPGGGGS